MSHRKGMININGNCKGDDKGNSNINFNGNYDNGGSQLTAQRQGEGCADSGCGWKERCRGL